MNKPMTTPEAEQRDRLANELSERKPIVLNGTSWVQGAYAITYAITKQERDLIVSALRSQSPAAQVSVSRPAPSPADMRAFGASDAACYKWPDDTPEHKALRAAYCEGAADCSPPPSPAVTEEEIATAIFEARKPRNDCAVPCAEGSIGCICRSGLVADARAVLALIQARATATEHSGG